MRRSEDDPLDLRTEVLLGSPLSEREIEILELAARGYTSTQTAEKLYLSTETIKGYRKRALSKLGARSLSQAVAYAIGIGLINITALMEYRDDVLPDYGDL